MSSQDTNVEERDRSPERKASVHKGVAIVYLYFLEGAEYPADEPEDVQHEELLNIPTCAFVIPAFEMNSELHSTLKKWASTECDAGFRTLGNLEQPRPYETCFNNLFKHDGAWQKYRSSSPVVEVNETGWCYLLVVPSQEYIPLAIEDIPLPPVGNDKGIYFYLIGDYISEGSYYHIPAKDATAKIHELFAFYTKRTVSFSETTLPAPPHLEFISNAVNDALNETWDAKYEIVSDNGKPYYWKYAPFPGHSRVYIATTN